MVTTRSRTRGTRGREHARSSTGGTTAEHAAKIYGVAMVSTVFIIAFLALTSVGHTIDAATQHFMLFYAGVFALIALCASVGLGLVATDRIMNPGNRIFVQAAHRAVSFGAVGFLIIHITTEILAQRVHVLDAVIPFLSPFRTFYIGLGTIASDLIILLVITGIMRSRFNANGNAWRWRAIHYASYAAFIFGIWHGLLAGRTAKPYVDWTYGFVVALVLLGLAVRLLGNSRRTKGRLSAPADPSATATSAPLRAPMHAQSATARAARTGPIAAATGRQQPLTSTGGIPVLTALPAGSVPDAPGRPYYEPGYEGPARYLGAPAPSGTGPIPRAGSGPMPRAASGAMPRAASGPVPQAASGHRPAAGTGPQPRSASGPIPRTPTGHIPRRPPTGPLPRPATGSFPHAATGSFPRPETGSFPRAAAGPLPRPATGPMDLGGGPVGGGPVGNGRRPPTGPLPHAATGSFPRAAAGPVPPPATGPTDFGAGRPGNPGDHGRVGQPDSYGYAGQPDPGWQDPAWQDPGRNSAWQEADWQYRAPTGGWYPGEQHWDGVPGSDTGSRYENPDSGPTGYRGSREHPYGGDA